MVKPKAANEVVCPPVYDENPVKIEASRVLLYLEARPRS
jgi:hypothetical protein